MGALSALKIHFVNDSPDISSWNPSIEFPDGAREMLYRNIDGSGDYITKNNWRGRCINGGNGGMIITSPEGVSYRMDQLSAIQVDDEKVSSSWYVSQIEDRFGHTIDITYQSQHGFLYLDTVSADDGRQIEFTYETDEDHHNCLRLTEISDGHRIVSYDYQAIVGQSGYATYCGYHLRQVQLPENETWTYDYYPIGHDQAGRFSLRQLTYPYGAHTTYTYAIVNFRNQLQPDNRQIVVESKHTAGPEMETGTWRYEYRAE